MADRALLIGINAYPYVNQLRGCLNDVEGMRALLTETFHFPDNAFRTLTNAQATKDRILAGARDWLFKDAKAGDRLVFHFSGHGSQVPDENDPTGVDEILCLYNIRPDLADPGAYLTDKELGELFASVPPGVRLFAVFDSCHSGTGTRELTPAVSRALGLGTEVRPLVLAKSPVMTVSRARDLESTEPEARHVESGQILVRFVRPPAALESVIRRRRDAGPAPRGFAERVRQAMAVSRTRSAGGEAYEERQVVGAPFDYVFYAACRSDQTAADASIEGAPHGAFTYYLTQGLTQLGAEGDRGRLDRQVSDELTSYDQEPQLETRSPTGPVFPAAAGGGDEREDTTPPPLDLSAFPEDALRTLGLALGRLIDWAQHGAPGVGVGRAARAVSGKVLVTVHGIGSHPAGYSNPWWAALGPFVPSLQPGDLGGKRQEVLWSDLVNRRGLERGVNAAKATDVSAQIKATLLDRAHRDLDAAAPTAPPTPGVAHRALDPRQAEVDRARARRDLSVPDVGGVDDFVNYLINPSVRNQVLARFFQVVRPLLQAGTEIELISHSWGTVVAYEGLLQLAQESGITGSVHNFFTVGSALSIFAVKPMLITDARNGVRPSMVERWVNLDARFDVVGGHLKGDPYPVDDEFLSLDPVGCTPGWLPQPACSHSSYFRSANLAVNRDIFGAFIES